LFDYTERFVVSTIDGKKYTVKNNFKDFRQASNILAKLNKINETVIQHMREKYANNPSIDAEFLADNYNGDVLSEHIPKGIINTSYVINKGDLIKLCIRHPKTGKFHDMNTLIFVNLHEISHLLDKEYGHSNSFWDGFKHVLVAAIELNLYTPIDYRKHPTSYCGLIISSSPLF
jgi:hypothetical protein